MKSNNNNSNNNSDNPTTITITDKDSNANSSNSTTSSTNENEMNQLRVVIPLDEFNNSKDKEEGKNVSKKVVKVEKKRRRRKTQREQKKKIGEIDKDIEIKGGEKDNNSNNDDDEKYYSLKTRKMYLIVSVVAVVFLIIGAAYFPILGNEYSCGDVDELGEGQQAVCHRVTRSRRMVARVKESGSGGGSFGVKAFVGGLPALSRETFLRVHAEKGIKIKRSCSVSYHVNLIHGSRVEYRMEASRAASMYVIRYRDYANAQQRVYFDTLADFYSESLVHTEDFTVCAGEFVADSDDLYVFAAVNSKKETVTLDWVFNITHTAYDIFNEGGGVHGDSDESESSSINITNDNDNDIIDDSYNDIDDNKNSDNDYNDETGIITGRNVCNGHTECEVTVNSSVYLIVYNSDGNKTAKITMGLFYPYVIRVVILMVPVNISFLGLVYLIVFMVASRRLEKKVGEIADVSLNEGGKEGANHSKEREE